MVGAAPVGAGGVHAAGAAQARLPAHQRAGEDLRDDPVQIVKEGRPLPQDAAPCAPLHPAHQGEDASCSQNIGTSLSRGHDLVVVTHQPYYKLLHMY